MASLSTVAPREAPRTSWSGIFAGTFVFLAIELTFGILGLTIFSGSASPVAVGTSGMNASFSIWMIVLSIVALYFAGRVAGHLSGAVRGLTGFYHGLVTFGMSCFASILVASIALSGAAQAASNPAQVSTTTLFDAAAKGGWALWLALLLGGIAACIGGTNAVPGEVRPVAERPNVRTAA